MPVDRRYTPSSGNNGKWFRHLGAESTNSDFSTTTYSRLFNDPHSIKIVPQFSQNPVFDARYRHNFKHWHPFSAHDTRYELQGNHQDHSYGYMGEIGMRRSEQAVVQNQSKPDFLSHYSAHIPMPQVEYQRFMTTTGNTYRGVIPTPLPHVQLGVYQNASPTASSASPLLVPSPPAAPANNAAHDSDLALSDMPRAPDPSQFRRYRRLYTAPAMGREAIRPSTDTIVRDVPPSETPAPKEGTFSQSGVNNSQNGRPSARERSLTRSLTMSELAGPRSRIVPAGKRTHLSERMFLKLLPEHATRTLSDATLMHIGLGHGKGLAPDGRNQWHFSYFDAYGPVPNTKRRVPVPPFSGSLSTLRPNVLPPAGVSTSNTRFYL